MNRFITVGSGLCDTNLPSLPQCQDSVNYPLYKSQIRGIILLPESANLPSDWTTAAGWDGVIDNSETAGQKGKYLAVIGDLNDEAVVVNFAKGRKQTLGRDFSINATHQRMDAVTFEFMKYLQSFRFDPKVRLWYETAGGNLFGGPQGIRPGWLDVSMPLDRDTNSYERADLTIEFRADTSQRRTETPFTTFTFSEEYQTVIEDDTGTVITDDSGVAIGVY